MEKIHFITSNKGKIFSLEKYFKKLAIDIDVEVSDLSLIEPQADTVKEVSKIKALAAYKVLKAPLIVEDGGMCIDVLNGFPGVYSKYVVETLGPDGILKLMDGEENRACKFVSVTTFVDENGDAHQFERLGGETTIATEKSNVVSDIAWSDYWYILKVPELDKHMAECSEEELHKLYEDDGQKSSLLVFAEWFKDNALPSNNQKHKVCM